MGDIKIQKVHKNILINPDRVLRHPTNINIILMNTIDIDISEKDLKKTNLEKIQYLLAKTVSL